MSKKLIEVSGLIRFHTVVYAESEQKALALVDTFSAEGLARMDGNADIVEVIDMDVIDVRDVPENYRGRTEAIMKDLAHMETRP